MTEAQNLSDCLVCKQSSLLLVHDFGTVPLADKLTDRPDEEVHSANLSLWSCPSCTHLQIGEKIDPEDMFRNEYPYLSSKIPEVSRHFQELAQELISKYKLTSNSTVVEIASNDGVLLNNFRRTTCNLLGVEPSLSPAAACEKLGIPVFKEFFNLQVAKQVNQKFPDGINLIVCSNVLAHVPDPNGFVNGLAELMSEESTLILEVPYARPMISNGTFDVIFHQHFSFFNLRSLKRLFENSLLYINDVKLIESQGGSLRLTVGKKNMPNQCLASMLDDELASGQFEAKNLKCFSERISEHRNTLMQMILDIVEERKTVVGYGAAGKSATLLNYYGINTEHLECLVDISSTKHGRYFPFTGLLVKPVEYIFETPPDFVVILAWNYTRQILKNLADLRKQGVRFITLYPEPKLV